MLGSEDFVSTGDRLLWKRLIDWVSWCCAAEGVMALSVQATSKGSQSVLVKGLGLQGLIRLRGWVELCGVLLPKLYNLKPKSFSTLSRALG